MEFNIPVLLISATIAAALYLILASRFQKSARLCRKRMSEIGTVLISTDGVPDNIKDDIRFSMRHGHSGVVSWILAIVAIPALIAVIFSRKKEQDIAECLPLHLRSEYHEFNNLYIYGNALRSPLACVIFMLEVAVAVLAMASIAKANKGIEAFNAKAVKYALAGSHNMEKLPSAIVNDSNH